MDVPAEGCTFLTDETLCEIYEDRPNACKVYPLVAKTPNCLLSGWVEPVKIFVGVARSGERMNLEFETAFLNMQKYLKFRGNWGGGFEAIGATVDDNQNDIVLKFLESDAEYLVLVEDDMVFEPNTASMMAWKMEENNQVGVDIAILCGLYFQRNDVPVPHFYRRTGIRDVNGEKAIQHESMVSDVEIMLAELNVATTDQPYVLLPGQGGERSVIEIDAGSTGLICIRRDVFEKIEYPWFRRMGAEVGQPGSTAPDLAFFFRAAEADIATYGDLGICAGHLALRPMAVKSFREWREAMSANGQSVENLEKVNA